VNYKLLIKGIGCFIFLQFLTVSAIHARNMYLAVDTPYFSFSEDMLMRMQQTEYKCNSVYVMWDSEFVNPYKVDVTQKTDTTKLILVNDTSFYVHPCPGKIYSGFGPRGGRNHNGVDMDLDSGDSVLCAFSGIIRFAKYYKGYGNMIIVTHYNGLETMYAHLSKMNYKVGDYVREGDLIGLGGATGRASGSHLHFEVRYMGMPFDPQLIIDFENHKLISDTFTVSKYTFKSYTKPAAPQVAASGNPQYHVIRQGDTLYALSKRYGVSIDKLCAMNGITRNTILRIGKSLRVH